MRKKRTHYQITMPPCQVCDNPEARPAYNSFVCNACRVFFSRHFADKFTFTCRESRSCTIHYQAQKTSCSACRLKKCFEANMTRDDIGKTVVGRLYLTRNSYTPMRTLIDMYGKFMSNGYKIIRNEGKNNSKWVNKMALLDSQILVPDGPSPSTVVAISSMSLTELLIVPGTCIDRTTTVCDGFSDTILLTPYKMVESLCRVFVAAVDCMESIEEFHTLSINDRLKLLQQNALMISIYLIYSFKFSKGWDSSNIFQYLSRFSNGGKLWTQTIECLVQNMEIEKSLEHIQPTEKEFMLLRIRSLFRPCTDHSDSGYSTILQARFKLTHRLAEHVRQNTPAFTSQSVEERLSHLLAMDQRLQNIGIKLNSAMPAVMNQGADPMVPPLLYDMFIRIF